MAYSFMKHYKMLQKTVNLSIITDTLGPETIVLIIKVSSNQGLELFYIKV